jgi:hypothetical protein
MKYLLVVSFVFVTSIVQAQTVIVDNADVGYAELEGTWNDYYTPGAHNGFLRRCYSSTAKAEWRTFLPTPSVYEVAIWFGYFPVTAPKSAIYTVFLENGDTLDFPFDQNKSNADRWQILGEFSFESVGIVGIRAGPTSPVVADAVKFTAIEVVPPAPPDSSMTIDEIKYWWIGVYRLNDNLNMEGIDTLRIDSTGTANMGISFVQPLYRSSYADQPDPITYTRGDTTLDYFFIIDPDSGNVIEDSAFVSITRQFELEAGNWAWTGRPVDTWLMTSKECNWQIFRFETEEPLPAPPEKPPMILINVKMEFLKKN